MMIINAGDDTIYIGLAQVPFFELYIIFLLYIVKRLWKHTFILHEIS